MALVELGLRCDKPQGRVVVDFPLGVTVNFLELWPTSSLEEPRVLRAIGCRNCPRLVARIEDDRLSRKRPTLSDEARRSLVVRGVGGGIDTEWGPRTTRRGRVGYLEIVCRLLDDRYVRPEIRDMEVYPLPCQKPSCQVEIG